MINEKLAEFLTDFQSELQQAYQYHYQYLKQLSNEDKVPLISNYTHLVLVETQENTEQVNSVSKEKSENSIEQKISEASSENESKTATLFNECLDNHERLNVNKNPLALEDLFTSKDNESSKKASQRICIYGGAGTGKTTLCEYLALQSVMVSSNKNVTKTAIPFDMGMKEETTESSYRLKEILACKFDSILLLKLPDMLGHLKNKPAVAQPASLLAQVVVQHYFPSKSITLQEHFIENLQQIIEDYSQRLLWVCDGLDEIIDTMVDGSAVQQCLETLAQQPYLTITARPMTIRTLGCQPIIFDKTLEIRGYHDRDIEMMVRRYRPDDTSAQTLLAFLQSQSNLWEIAHTPLLLELICCVVIQDDTLVNKQVTMTMTQLYSSIMTKMYDIIKSKMINRQTLLTDFTLKSVSNVGSQSDKDELPELQDPLGIVQYFLYHLAYLGIQQKTSLLEPKLVQRALDEVQNHYHLSNQPVLHQNILRLAQGLGWIKPIAGEQRLLSQTQYFVYPGFQAFCAACWVQQQWLAQAPSQTTRDQLAQYKYTPSMQLMWRMSIGLLYQAGQMRIQQGKANPHGPLIAFWEVVCAEPWDANGVLHIKFIAQGLEECQANRTIPIHQTLLRQLAAWFDYGVRQEKVILELLAPCFSVLSSPELLAVANEIWKNELSSHFFWSVLPLLNKMSATVYRSANTTQRQQIIQALLRSPKNQYDNDNKTSAANQVLIALMPYLPVKAVPSVIEALVADYEKNENVRSSVVRALAALVPYLPATTVPLVIELLLSGYKKQGNHWYTIKMVTTRALGTLGPYLPAEMMSLVVETLVVICKESGNIGTDAFKSLVALGPHLLTEMVPPILELLVGGYEVNTWAKRTVSTDNVVKKLIQKLSTKAMFSLVEGLMANCQDENGAVRRAAIAALTTLWPYLQTEMKHTLVDTLLKNCKDENWWINETARDVLDQLMPYDLVEKMPLIIEDLLARCQPGEGRGGREAATRNLATLELPAKAVPLVVKTLLVGYENESKWVKRAVVWALEPLGPRLEEEMVPLVARLLIDACQCNYWGIRRIAYAALATLKQPLPVEIASLVIKCLLGGCTDKNWRVRRSAIKALGTFVGPNLPIETVSLVFKALLAGYADNNRIVRKSAHAALIALRSCLAVAEVEIQLSVIKIYVVGWKADWKDEYYYYYYKDGGWSSNAFVELLLHVSEEAVPLVTEYLLDLINSQNKHERTVQDNAYKALGALGPRLLVETVPLVVKILMDSCHRLAAYIALVTLRRHLPVEMVPSVDKVLVAGCKNMSLFQTIAIAACEPHLPAEIMPLIVKALIHCKDRDRVFHFKTISKNLEKLMPHVSAKAMSSVVKVLVAGCKNNDWGVRRIAYITLKALGPALVGEEQFLVAKTLMAGCKDQDWVVRQTACEVLGVLGPNLSEKAIPSAVQAIVAGCNDDILQGNRKKLYESEREAITHLIASEQRMRLVLQACNRDGTFSCHHGIAAYCLSSPQYCVFININQGTFLMQRGNKEIRVENLSSELLQHLQECMKAQAQILKQPSLNVQDFNASSRSLLLLSRQHHEQGRAHQLFQEADEHDTQETYVQRQCKMM